MAEMVFSYDNRDGFAILYSDAPKGIKLAHQWLADHPDETELMWEDDGEDAAIQIKFPAAIFTKFGARWPKRAKKELTEEQLAALRERASKARAAIGTKKKKE